MENMEDSIDHRPFKRVKITHEQKRCSTFECLSGELILKLFGYFNTKEIAQSFFNLTAFINSCIFDQRQQLHLHLDHQMPVFPRNYSPNQVISLYIEHLIIPLDTFPNLKSLHIVHDNEKEDECLNMVKQVFKLTQLVNFRLSLVGSELTETGHETIKTSFFHPSLRRIILSKSKKTQLSDPLYTMSPVKLVFPSVKFVYVSNDFHGENIRQLHYQIGLIHCGPEPTYLTKPEYHVRFLDIALRSSNMWKLERILSFLPLLIELKLKGRVCCSFRWHFPSVWNNVFQNLKALQRVTIDIEIVYPKPIRQSLLQTVNNAIQQKFSACKRINMALGTKPRAVGMRDFLHLTASLNMD